MNRVSHFHLILVAAAALAFVAAAGCASGPAKVEPPTIYYGEDVCDQCGMVISDERFAAASVVEVAPGQTEARVFDDVGDLFLYHEEHADETVLARYVHDYNTQAWLAAEDAFYVASDAIHSPMVHGVAAFATRKDAGKMAADVGGETLDYAGLVALADAGAFDPAHTGQMPMDMGDDTGAGQ